MKRIQINDMAETEKLRHHLILIATCFTMIMAGFCLVVNAAGKEAVVNEAANNEVTATEAADRNDGAVGQAEEEHEDKEADAADGQTADSTTQARDTTYDENNYVNDDVLEAPVIAGSWKKEAGGWRFYNGAGVMQTGLCSIDGKKYYFGTNDGLMKTSWQKIGRYYYYFGTDGAMKTGWQKIGGCWYYFDKAGAMLIGHQELDGKKYYFGDHNDGVMKTGWISVGEFQEKGKKIADIWSYYGADGAALRNSWLKYGGYWYYFDELCEMETDTTLIDGKGYYFGGPNDGRMKIGWQQIEGKWVYLGTDGAVRTGWQQVGGCWYYLGKHGEMETGFRNIDGGLYCLGSDGAMKTGWQKKSNDWYYFNASGAAVKGWQYVGGNWFYFEKDHKMVRNTIKELDSKRYAFNADGVMLFGTFKLNGETYLTDASGAIVDQLKGIDVSEFQGNINWQKVKAAGIDFVIIRAGYRGKKYGTLAKDSKFEQNIAGAIAAGLKVGAYMFSEAIDYTEGAEEARYLVSLIKKYDIKLPLVVDTEYQSGARSNGISVAARTTAIKGFCETIQALGYTPMIYASTSWLNNNLDMRHLSAYRVWVAQYYSKVTYKGRYDVWQYTSKGKVDGISGNVDMNYWYNR
ncbi:GH25 family lysozyme [Mogibacterium timidum]|uniref:Glycoside hydrolase, family 25 n=1 Tax=Mogibacterium timidum ATCC 33093 TaxID=1401079 RepID=X8J737_9FIRM|nr:GH25 family lysozyme [Mogibacterium timidum]EUC58103.1 glycoside hydrolase, family 25 [Mogibacterium timidum ATCC 33093]